MRRHTLWPLLLACAVGLLAAWPYYSNPGLPAGTDVELHVFRTAELGYSLRAGALYPRWAPDFYHGHGYPIFNYYAPLTYYLSFALALGRPEAAAVGVRLTLILAQVLGAVGAYQLGRLFGRRGGGLLGAIAFSFSPYVQLVNPHVRGAVAESVALAFLPWALWAWEVLWRRGERALVPAVLTTSAVFLSHNLTGLSCVGLLAGLGLARCASGARRHLRPALLAAVIFVLVTAFFWLPFLVERSAIKLEVAGDGHYDYRNHFVPFRELTAWLEPMDRRAASPHIPMSAGPATLAIAVAGLGLSIARLRRVGWVGFYAIAASALLWLVTPGSQWVWEHLPGLRFYQFPWRFLGPLATCLVPLVSMLGTPLNSPRARRCSSVAGVRVAIAALVALSLLVPALVGLYPLPWTSGFEAILPPDIIRAELAGRWRGTTSTNDFVPATVAMIPGPQQSVLESYEHPPVDRVNRATLPPDAIVRVVPDRPWVNAFRVSSPREFVLRLYLFDFPGWRASIDGRDVPIVVANPEGFITVTVPAGDHEVVVRFGPTPVRRLAWMLSGFGMVVMLSVAGRRRWHRRTSPFVGRCRNRGADLDDIRTVRGVAIAVLLVLVTTTLVLDHVDWLQPTAPPGAAVGVDHLQGATFGSAGEDAQIALLGYNLKMWNTRVTRTLDVVLYWNAQRDVVETYQSFVHVVSPEGTIWTQSDQLNPGGFPTNLWPTDRYVVDVHRLEIPTEAPAGPYLLSVGLYTLAGEGGRLDVLSADCGQRADSVVLCTPILVRR